MCHHHGLPTVKSGTKTFRKRKKDISQEGILGKKFSLQDDDDVTSFPGLLLLSHVLFFLEVCFSFAIDSVFCLLYAAAGLAMISYRVFAFLFCCESCKIMQGLCHDLMMQEGSVIMVSIIEMVQHYCLSMVVYFAIESA